MNNHNELSDNKASLKAKSSKIRFQIRKVISPMMSKCEDCCKLLSKCVCSNRKTKVIKMCSANDRLMVINELASLNDCINKEKSQYIEAGPYIEDAVADVSNDSDISCSGISIVSQSPPRRLEGLNNNSEVTKNCDLICQIPIENIPLPSDHSCQLKSIAEDGNLEMPSNSELLNKIVNSSESICASNKISPDCLKDKQNTSPDYRFSFKNSYKSPPSLLLKNCRTTMNNYYLTSRNVSQNNDYNFLQSLPAQTSNANACSPHILLENAKSIPSAFTYFETSNNNLPLSPLIFSHQETNNQLSFTSSPNFLLTKDVDNYTNSITPKKAKSAFPNSVSPKTLFQNLPPLKVSPINEFKPSSNIYKSPLLSRNNSRKSLNSSDSFTYGSSDFSMNESYSKILFNESARHLYNCDFQSKFIDTHCHLDFLFKRMGYQGSYKDFKNDNWETFPKSYEGCIGIFCDPQTFGNSNVWSDLLDEDEVWGSFGCHPHYADQFTTTSEIALRERLFHTKVIALGEIGLDYSNRNSCDILVQQSVFRTQLKIAVDYGKPLVIHCRDASADCLQIMKEIVPQNYLIHRHCYTGSLLEIQSWMGYFSNIYFGFTPVVTYPSATQLHEVLTTLPLNRILLETDTPYFVPRKYPKEKHWSHPGMAIHVAEKIEELKSYHYTLTEVLSVTRENAKKVYNI